MVLKSMRQFKEDSLSVPHSGIVSELLQNGFITVFCWKTILKKLSHYTSLNTFFTEKSLKILKKEQAANKLYFIPWTSLT